eukprot:794749_1
MLHISARFFSLSFSILSEMLCMHWFSFIHSLTNTSSDITSSTIFLTNASSMLSIFAAVIVEMSVAVLPMITAIKLPTNRQNDQSCKSVLNPCKSPWRNMQMFKLGGAPLYSIDYRWTSYSNIHQHKIKRKGAINIVRTRFSSKMLYENAVSESQIICEKKK